MIKLHGFTTGMGSTGRYMHQECRDGYDRSIRGTRQVVMGTTGPYMWDQAGHEGYCMQVHYTDQAGWGEDYRSSRGTR